MRLCGESGFYGWTRTGVTLRGDYDGHCRTGQASEETPYLIEL